VKLPMTIAAVAKLNNVFLLFSIGVSP